MSRKILEALRTASPIGRLESHEQGLILLGAERPDLDISQYRRYVEIARSHANQNTFELRIYLGKADNELTHLLWEDDPDRKSGEAHRKAVIDSRKNTRGMRQATIETIAEMNRLISNGHSDANAARLAHKAGFGTSSGGNARAYTRWKEKQKSGEI